MLIKVILFIVWAAFMITTVPDGFGMVVVALGLFALVGLIYLAIISIKKSEVAKTLISFALAVAISALFLLGLSKCSGGGGRASGESSDGIWDNARR